MSNTLSRGFQALADDDFERARQEFVQSMHDPADRVSAHRGLAAVAWRQGKEAGAVQLLEEAVRLEPEHLEARADLALVLSLSDRVRDALPHLQRLVEISPGESRLWHNYALGLANSGAQIEATRAFERAVALGADRETYVELAKAYEALGARKQALQAWSRCIELYPDAELAYYRLTSMLMVSGRYKECLNLFRKATAQLPRAAGIRVAFGELLEDLGDASAAAAEYRAALDIWPSWPPAVAALVKLLGASSDAGQMSAAKELLDDASTSEDDRALLGYAVGRAMDESGDHVQAMRAWTVANQARRRQSSKSRTASVASRVDRLKDVFTPELFTRCAGWGLPDVRPTFVLGMPRSGTTLVEQILSSHPQVRGCGELDLIGRSLEVLCGMSGSIRGWPEVMQEVDEAQVYAAATLYLSELEGNFGRGADRLIDKAPLNFFNIGIIRILFPNAHIIWCQRDPRDVCLSIFSENFSASHSFATDLKEVGEYYVEHMRLMHHWEACCGGRIHTLRYEQLVVDVEASVRNVLQAIGLSWSHRCLDFWNQKRIVATPSRWKVRDEISAKSVGRWRRYESQLGPLLDTLSPILEDSP